MGWGTDFTASIYLNRETYNNIWEVEQKIEELEEDLNIINKTLISTSSMTPIKEDEDSMFDLARELIRNIDEILEWYKETAVRIYKLNLYLEKLKDNQS